ncbi:hypothetical protein GQ42DRAFT_172852, partial [Ramicandelaber brevisporus]
SYHTSLPFKSELSSQPIIITHNTCTFYSLFFQSSPAMATQDHSPFLSHKTSFPTPFRLFHLPHELIEYIATFFSRREATRVIKCNRQFHHYFVRSVWSTICASWIEDPNDAQTPKNRYFERRISATGLKLYGHLVSRLIINGKNRKISDYAAWIPNVMVVDFDEEIDIDLLKSGELDLLRNVNKVYFNLGLYPEYIDVIINWMNNDTLSGHINKVCISLFMDIMDYKLRNYVAKIKNPRRLQLITNCGEDGLLSYSDLLHIAPYHVTMLDVGGACDVLCIGQYLHEFFSFAPQAKFPNVTKLSLTICGTGHPTNSCIGLTPLAFPAVTTLSLHWDDWCCENSNDNPIPVLLSHPWRSVKSLTLDGPVINTDTRIIASTFPNITHLRHVNCGSWTTVSYSTVCILPEVKFLQFMCIRNLQVPEYEQPERYIHPAHCGTYRLRYLAVDSIAFNKNVVAFIFGTCRNLRILGIDCCTITQPVLDYAHYLASLVQSNVRQINILGTSISQHSEWMMFIRCFQSIQKVNVMQSIELASPWTQLADVVNINFL